MSSDTTSVLVYSDDAQTREQVRLAIGRRPAPDVPRVEFVECATEPAVFDALRGGRVDVGVLDGEAWPAGGMGICRQAKDEIYECPPFVVIVGRREDGWLATWSRAEAVTTHPVDPIALAEAVAGLIRQRLGDTAGGAPDTGPRSLDQAAADGDAAHASERGASEEPGTS